MPTATQVQLRGGTTAQHTTFAGVEREVTVDTTTDSLVVHTGGGAGTGVRQASESYVETRIASIGSGLAQSLTLWAMCG